MIAVLVLLGAAKLAAALMLADVVVAVGVQWAVLASGALIPWLTALATNDIAPGWLQVAVMSVLSAVGGVVATLTTSGGQLPLVHTLYAIAMTALVAFISHYGYNVSGALPAVVRATGRFGLGPSRARVLGAARQGAQQVVQLPSGYHLVGPPDAVRQVKVLKG